MKLTTILSATIGMMVAATIGLYVAKVLAWAPVLAWPWWAIYAPLWGPWVLAVFTALVLLLSVALDRWMQKFGESI